MSPATHHTPRSPGSSAPQGLGDSKRDSRFGSFLNKVETKLSSVKKSKELTRSGSSSDLMPAKDPRFARSKSPFATVFSLDGSVHKERKNKEQLEFEVLAEALANKHEGLDLHNLISPSALSALDAAQAHASLQHVKEMNLAGTNIGAVGVDVMSRVFTSAPNLTSLSLRDTKLGSKAIHVIAECFSSMSCLTKLDLGENAMGNSGVADVARALRDMKSLLSLDLGYNKLNQVAATDLAGALRWNPQIETLVLDVNLFLQEGVEEVARILQFTTNLTSLNLRQNAAGIQGCQTLIAQLPHCNQLKYLNLASNAGGQNMMRSLAACAHQMHSLETLDVSNNGVTGVPRGMVGLNKLQHLHIDHKHLLHPPKEVLEKGVGRTFSYLRQNPVTLAMSCSVDAITSSDASQVSLVPGHHAKVEVESQDSIIGRWIRKELEIALGDDVWVDDGMWTADEVKRDLGGTEIVLICVDNKYTTTSRRLGEFKLVSSGDKTLVPILLPGYQGVPTPLPDNFAPSGMEALAGLQWFDFSGDQTACRASLDALKHHVHMLRHGTTLASTPSKKKTEDAEDEGETTVRADGASLRTIGTQSEGDVGPIGGTVSKSPAVGGIDGRVAYTPGDERGEYQPRSSGTKRPGGFKSRPWSAAASGGGNSGDSRPGSLRMQRPQTPLQRYKDRVRERQMEDVGHSGAYQSRPASASVMRLDELSGGAPQRQAQVSSMSASGGNLGSQDVERAVMRALEHQRIELEKQQRTSLDLARNIAEDAVRTALAVERQRRSQTCSLM